MVRSRRLGVARAWAVVPIVSWCVVLRLGELEWLAVGVLVELLLEGR